MKISQLKDLLKKYENEKRFFHDLFGDDKLIKIIKKFTIRTLKTDFDFNHDFIPLCQNHGFDLSSLLDKNNATVQLIEICQRFSTIESLYEKLMAKVEPYIVENPNPILAQILGYFRDNIQHYQELLNIEFNKYGTSSQINSNLKNEIINLRNFYKVVSNRLDEYHVFFRFLTENDNQLQIVDNLISNKELESKIHRFLKECKESVLSFKNSLVEAYSQYCDTDYALTLHKQSLLKYAAFIINEYKNTCSTLQEKIVTNIQDELLQIDALLIMTKDMKSKQSLIELKERLDGYSNTINQDKSNDNNNQITILKTKLDKIFEEKFTEVELQELKSNSINASLPMLSMVKEKLMSTKDEAINIFYNTLKHIIEDYQQTIDKKITIECHEALKNSYNEVKTQLAESLNTIDTTPRIDLEITLMKETLKVFAIHNQINKQDRRADLQNEIQAILDSELVSIEVFLSISRSTFTHQLFRLLINNIISCLDIIKQESISNKDGVVCLDTLWRIINDFHRTRESVMNAWGSQLIPNIINSSSIYERLCLFSPKAHAIVKDTVREIAEKSLSNRSAPVA